MPPTPSKIFEKLMLNGDCSENVCCTMLILSLHAQVFEKVYYTGLLYKIISKFLY